MNVKLVRLGKINIVRMFDCCAQTIEVSCSFENHMSNRSNKGSVVAVMTDEG